jgi:cytochrome c5
MHGQWRPQQTWMLAAALLTVSCALSPLLRNAQQLSAAPPHLISPGHPYDADWPEVRHVLNTKCTSCHRDQTPRADLTTAAAILQGQHEGRPLVVPGRPDESLLWRQVAWNAEAHRGSPLPDTPDMPPQREEWLTAGQLQAVYRWIANGAQEYAVPDGCRQAIITELDFPSARQCAGCHPRQYEEWARSMHAYGQHSPVFEAFNLTLVERTGGTIGSFCTRCHTPIGTALGENGSRRNVNRSRISMEGVTCVTCHRRYVGQYKSSGRTVVVPGQVWEGCLFGPFDAPASQEVGAHRSVHLAYIKQSQFCGDCHDVTSPDGVRLEEAFSEWNNSPAAQSGITCHACHMGPVQGLPIPDDQRPLGPAAVVPGVDPSRMPLRRLSDHTFAGPDYSLLPDTEFPHKLDWMYEVDYRHPSNLTPYQQRTLLELRLRNQESLHQANLKRYELLRNAARLRVEHPPTALAGPYFPVRVDVISTTAGHSLPTGFTAERQVWVSIEIRDAQGQRVFASGDPDHNADLRDEHSHAVLSGATPFDRYLLNFQNKFTVLGHKGAERSVVISVNRDLGPVNVLRPATGLSASFGRPPGFRVSKGSLPPLRTVGRTYPVTLPPCSGDYHLDVRLNFRHLPPALLDAVGTPHLKHLLEVVVIDRYEATISVAGSNQVKR